MTSLEALSSTALTAVTIKYVVDVIKYLFPRQIKGRTPARLAVLFGMSMYVIGYYMNKTPPDMDVLTAIGYGFVSGVLASGYNSQTKPTKEIENRAGLAGTAPLSTPGNAPMVFPSNIRFTSDGYSGGEGRTPDQTRASENFESKFTQSQKLDA